MIKKWLRKIFHFLCSECVQIILFWTENSGKFSKIENFQTFESFDFSIYFKKYIFSLLINIFQFRHLQPSYQVWFFQPLVFGSCLRRGKMRMEKRGKNEDGKEREKWGWKREGKMRMEKRGKNEDEWGEGKKDE